MVEITIRCNRRERDQYFVPDPKGERFEWKVAELRFSVEDAEITNEPKGYIIDCYYCGDIFGILLSSKLTNYKTFVNNAFPISKIKTNFKSPIWGTTHTHTIWQTEPKRIIGKVGRWDNTDVYEYSGKQIYNKISNLIDNGPIKNKLRTGWENNYFINSANRKLALWYVKMNPNCSILDLYDFFILNKLTDDLVWIERLVKDLMNKNLLKSNKSRFFMNYMSSPDEIELNLTAKGEKQVGSTID